MTHSENKYILILAKTSHDKTPYGEWLADSGISAVILVAAEYFDGYRHLENVYPFEDYDQSPLVEQTALRLGESFPFIGVFARAEADVIRAARIREKLLLPGQDLKSAVAYRDKVIMKDYLRGSGVLLPEYRAVSETRDILDFVAQHGYPVVIKPRSASGSFNTFIIRNDGELDVYVGNQPGDQMEIETYVEGKMHHVDGLIVDGHIVFVQPFQYINDCLSFRKNEFIGNCTLPPDDPLHDRLAAAARDVLTHLPPARHMAFHAEFWHTPDDRIVFCEIASRTGGGMISYAVVHTFGLDIDREWLLAECGLSHLDTPPGYRPGGCICIPPLNGVLEHMPDSRSLDHIRQEVFTGKIGERYHGGVKSGLFLVGYVISGCTQDEVIRKIEDTARWFGENSRWTLQ